MTKTNVLLMWGGAGAEHEISALSAAFIEQSLAGLPDMAVVTVELVQEGHYINAAGSVCQLVKNITSGFNELVFNKPSQPAWQVDFVIPCFHGFPGESGDIQSLFELMNIPYLGCRSEASVVCFNKVTTKLWLSTLGIPNTPYITMDAVTPEQIDKACKALQQWHSVFVKASSQGSSVGCYQVSDEHTLKQCLLDAFNYSSYVLVEKCVKGRELEVAVYEYEGDIVATLPGEIHSPEGSFYTYEEKYHDSSVSTTDVVAKDILPESIELIKCYAINTFIGLKLRHLSRIDFFLTQEGDILVNEINTFPGMTPISMFPKMMNQNGHQFTDFMTSTIHSAMPQKQ